MVGAVICAGYIPALAVYWTANHPVLPNGALLWILGSGILKTSYSLFLQRGYRHGDFSLVYPVARGTGPLLSTLAAILFLGKRPTSQALVGSMIIVASIFWLTGGWEKAGAALQRRNRVSSVSGDSPLTRVCRSILVDELRNYFRRLHRELHVTGQARCRRARDRPWLYDAGTAFKQLGLLTPFAARRWPEVVSEWRTKKRWIFGVALLSPVAYVLILTAMKFTPVSYVAPAREVSIVIGAFIGARFLHEANGRRRLLAALAMAVGGVIALALG